MIFLLICLLIGVFTISFFMFKKCVTPYSIFIGNYTICFILFYGSNYVYHNLSAKAWLILGMSMLGFSTGVFFAKIVPKRKIETSNIYGNNEVLYKLAYIAFMLSLIGAMTYYIIIQKTLGLTNVLADPSILNTAISESTIGIGILPVVLMKLSLPNVGLLFSLYLKDDSRNKNLLLLMLIELLMNISVRRNVFIYMVVLLIFIYYFSEIERNKPVEFGRNVKNVIVFFLTASSLVYFFQTLQRILRKETIFLEAKLFGITISSSFLTILLYYVGNPISFSIYIDKNLSSNVPIFGATFRYIYILLKKVTNLKFDDSFLALDFVNTPQLFNTTFSQFYIYSEGGLIWTIIFYFLLGFVSTIIFLRYKNNNNIFYLNILSFTSLLLVLMIREYMPISLDFWICVMYYLIFNKLIRKRKN